MSISRQEMKDFMKGECKYFKQHYNSGMQLSDIGALSESYRRIYEANKCHENNQKNLSSTK